MGTEAPPLVNTSFWVLPQQTCPPGPQGQQLPDWKPLGPKGGSPSQDLRSHQKASQAPGGASANSLAWCVSPVYQLIDVAVPVFCPNDQPVGSEDFPSCQGLAAWAKLSPQQGEVTIIIHLKPETKGGRWPCCYKEGKGELKMSIPLARALAHHPLPSHQRKQLQSMGAK